jgi:hypothetical protein
MRRDGLAETAGRNARPLMHGTRKNQKDGWHQKKSPRDERGPFDVAVLYEEFPPSELPPPPPGV